ncbi:DUF402 domain-containing protein [Pseudonocardia sp. GCM10023141]|uniref:DUF402 domain-containing protein n=1 Tax=Pseudonocardia sp. GCM10023141 TaxID=3252653 RepID=UPI00360BB18E
MSAVRVVFGKWGGGAHWEYDAVHLGDDQHGRWLGAVAGTVLSRPGSVFTTDYDHVVLVPDTGFVASFNADVDAAPARIYVDIATPPVWDGQVVRCIDLDLDVIRDRADRVWVDDEDEFAEHQVALGYPDAVVEQALRSCAAVLEGVRSRSAPFDDVTAARWLGELAGRDRPVPTP